MLYWRAQSTLRLGLVCRCSKLIIGVQPKPVVCSKGGFGCAAEVACSPQAAQPAWPELAAPALLAPLTCRAAAQVRACSGIPGCRLAGRSDYVSFQPVGFLWAKVGGACRCRS